MQIARPSHLIDPVCGMSVDVDEAERDGRLLERDGRTYAFCRQGCLRAFVDDPGRYVDSDGPHIGSSLVTDHSHDELPVIDEGMRRWYESCSCCLSEAYPDIKARLDAERATAAVAQPDPGICEVAEASVS